LILRIVLEISQSLLSRFSVKFSIRFPWLEAVATTRASDREIFGMMALKIYEVKVLLLFGCHVPKLYSEKQVVIKKSGSGW